MKTFDVKIVSYEDLPKEILVDGLSNNGCGKEYASYLLVYLDGKLLRCESSAVEPEDASFNRDYNSVKDALEEAFNMGMEHEASTHIKKLKE